MASTKHRERDFGPVVYSGAHMHDRFLDSRLSTFDISDHLPCGSVDFDAKLHG